MLWSKEKSFHSFPFETESDLEKAIVDSADAIFGKRRVYVDTKKKIGVKGKTQNIPDGYLIDLTSPKEPRIFVVENELSKHEPLKHIAVQILEFSLSFETSPHSVKNILKDGLVADAKAMKRCQEYVDASDMDNVDVLLERLVHGSGRFNALVVIDELDSDLEQVLMNKFKFPVEVVTFERFRADSGEFLYRFDPFLGDVVSTIESGKVDNGSGEMDPSNIDTIVVPAREDGFNEVFIGEDRWYAIRIHPSMVPRIKYIAAYRVAPESAITHIAPVSSIDQWRETNKYVVNFSSPAEVIGPIRLKANGKVIAPRGPRYTTRELLAGASTLDEAF